MDRRLLAACLVVGGLGLGPGAAPCGAVADESVSVGDVRLGAMVTGPGVTADDLKGHVVLMEFWGIH